MMRSTTLALITVFALATSAAAVTYETRSEHYAITVDNTAVSAKVVVTDLDSNSPVISEEVLWSPGQPSAIDRTMGDLHFALRLTRSVDVLAADLKVVRGDMEIDWIRASWRFAPRHVPPPGLVRVGGDVHAPQVVHRVEPVYPTEARVNKISGVVVVETVIDATGRVTDVRALQGPPELVQPAIDAVKQWTFVPATKAGKPVPVLFNLTVNFKLN